jgi:hypothetical protein
MYVQQMQGGTTKCYRSTEKICFLMTMNLYRQNDLVLHLQTVQIKNQNKETLITLCKL